MPETDSFGSTGWKRQEIDTFNNGGWKRQETDAFGGPGWKKVRSILRPLFVSLGSGLNLQTILSVIDKSTSTFLHAYGALLATYPAKITYP